MKAVPARLLQLLVPLVSLLLLVSLPAAAQVSSERSGIHFDGPFGVGELGKGLVDEASGLAAGRLNPKLLWTHNDSGDGPMVYAISQQGEMRCSVAVGNAKHVDWEDIAIGPGPKSGVPYIYVGDIGDNNAKRSSITVYRFAEPRVDGREKRQDVAADALTFTYPDGARDAEALIVDPLTQDLYIITKREKYSRVYMASAPHEGGSTRVLTFVSELPINMVTAGDISQVGNEILLKNYVYTYYWSRSGREPLATAFKRSPIRVNYMPEPQGEAICFAEPGDGYYTISERPDTAWATEVLYYGKRTGELGEVVHLRDKNRPQLTIAPSRDTEGLYDLRYTVPQFSPIKIYVHNFITMRVRTVEENTSEAGVQEREIDMIDAPDGTYYVVLRAGTNYAAIPLEVER